MMIRNGFFAATLISFLCVTSCVASEQSAPASNTAMQGEPQDADVKVPALPRKISIAGEAMPIERFDVRERMEEDMGVTIYMHSRTLRTLRSAHRYFPDIEAALEKAGVPDDFKYLAMAESGLNSEARSSAGAAGIWQIMAATAKEHGLEVNSEVDERYNIEKSTAVACKYLNTAYKRFGNWTMAAASYNVGMAGVSSRNDKQNNVDNYYDLFLPEETMRYVYRVASFKVLMSDPAFYGFKIDEDQYYKPFKYKEIKVSGANISWSKVAKDNGTTYKMLRILNPWIRSYTHTNKALKSYSVKVPIGE